MTVLRNLANLFLLPGTLVLNASNISVESDGGIFRSFINMIFWGFIAFTCAIPFMFG